MKKIELIKPDNNRAWSIEVYNKPDGTAQSVIEWGTIYGKMTTKLLSYHVGKNIGKSNETTPFEQAWLEAISIVKKKLDANYFLKDPSQVAGYESLLETKKTIRPMLATKFSKQVLPSQVAIQPKLDGIRCIGRFENGKVVLTTRQGKAIDLLYHIESELYQIFANPENKDLIFDGEIYNHEMNFQEITSAVKKQNKNTRDLQYHIYDLIDVEKFYDYRRTIIETLDLNTCSFIIKVQTKIAHLEEIKPFYDYALKTGYEGIMIRYLDSKYDLDKRSKNLLKYKPVDDAEFEIIGFEKEILSNNKEGVIYKCKTETGKIFNVRPTGTVKARIEELLSAEDQIGKLYTVQFQGLTNDGIPRFPVGKGVRFDTSHALHAA